MSDENKLTRIGVFYDGNYFHHVSNYYYYRHERRSRISISGLHDFIREEVAKSEDTDVRYCQVVDAHYFRGRLLASKAQERELLFKERQFEDVLIREGVVTHYLPLSQQGEKGIDVWFALEAFELAIYKKFDVSVLVACDSDYVPLVRKLNTLGTRVMVLGWDFKFIDEDGKECETRTSQSLLNEVSYPVLVSSIIEDRTRRNDPIINNLFFKPGNASSASLQPSAVPDDKVLGGVILNVLAGYGFIAPDYGGENIFFHYQDVVNKDFNELKKGDRVEFLLGNNDKGPCARFIRIKSSALY